MRCSEGVGRFHAGSAEGEAEAGEESDGGSGQGCAQGDFDVEDGGPIVW
jgi:hypothetical protein